MAQINPSYRKLAAGYLFPEIARRTRAFQAEHPDAEILRLGIGDTTEALTPTVIEGLHAAVDALGSLSTYSGYGDSEGTAALRQAIASRYKDQGGAVHAEDVFVSDGAKCDTGNIQEIFAADIRIAIPDPVYPVYLDTNVMAGRTGSFQEGRYDGLTYLESTR